MTLGAQPEGGPGVSMHQIPDDGTKHLRGRECPCGPQVAKRRVSGVVRTVFAHNEMKRAVPAGDVELPEADCGHIVVDVDGDQQHHEIPDDGAPHAPSTECGCGPQRVTSGEHVVFVHVDQGADNDTEQLYREVFGA